MGYKSVLRSLGGSAIALFAVFFELNYLEASPAVFTPSSAPTASEWQRFNAMTESERSNVWRHFSSRGVGFPQWSWQWRIGWVRSCGVKVPTDIPCPSILSAALKDDAAVVRAESAQAIGARYRNQYDPKVAVELEAAFKDPRNVRQGKPLFVCDRVLMALRQMGDRRALSKADKLAGTFDHTKDYWRKIKGLNTTKF
jgi:hypothetical protein